MQRTRGLAIRFSVAALLLPGAAFAADPITFSTSAGDASGIPVHDESVADWSGFYAGIFGAAQLEAADAAFGGGVLAGVNAQFDFYLVGAEVAVHGLTDGSGANAYGQLVGHAGLILDDDVAVYAAAGYGLDLGTGGEQDLLLGGGVEYAVTEDVSLRAQYLHGFSLDGGADSDQLTFGANFHF